MNAENLNFDSSASVVSVTELRGQFPNLPPRILVTLAVMSFLARTVTPFRLCQCGCGESVHGKARLASPACRQRVSREARAIRATAPKQFNLVLQHEIPVTIPFSPAPRDHGSAPLTLEEVWHSPDKCDAAETVELSEPTSEISDWKNDGDYSGIPEKFPHDTVHENQLWLASKTNDFRLKFCQLQHYFEHQPKHPDFWAKVHGFSYTDLDPRNPATRASHTSQPHEPATRARTFPRFS